MAYEGKFVLLGFFSQQQTAGTQQERDQFRDQFWVAFDAFVAGRS